MNFRYGKKEVEYLKAKDRKLGAVIDRIGHVRFEVDGDLFSGVVGNIVHAAHGGVDRRHHRRIAQQG